MIAVDLARLKGRPMTDYTFPFWQAAILLTVIGLVLGLDPSLGVPLPFAFLIGIVVYWVWFWVCLRIMRWWLVRGNRWDGQGWLDKVIIASWGIDMLLPLLAFAGVPGLLLLPLWLYTLWVMANAISDATDVTLGYSIAGILIATVVFVVGLALLTMAVAIGLVFTGILPGGAA
ncbi:hypothetical protein [Ectothiorhodospira shaposhnikovii]|uniref:hypothetical protein n=1 Tax=Ectothiorhodospira shaposhnikovii TaxID=1054 RepID=UPI0039A0AF3E